MRSPRARVAAALCGLAAVLCLGGVYGAEDDEIVNFSGQDPTEQELIDALTPRPAMRTRGISPGAVTAGGAAIGPAVMPQPKVSFDQITFGFNSDRITNKARPILDKLGHALASDELTAVEFSIEGHTDSVGSLEYNMRLSKRRAEAVKRYLVENHQIEASRLTTVGRGPTDLLDKDYPQSGVNRRVVFTPE